MRRVARVLVATVLPLTIGTAAHGHEVDSASLKLRETGDGQFAVRWRASSPTLQRDLGSAVLFPAACRLDAGDRLDCGRRGLVGAISFPWLEGTMTRVIIDVEWRDGSRFVRVATASAPAVSVYGSRASGWHALRPIVLDYVRLGVEHILTGYDHLLFVVALTLLVRRRRALLATITAFTIAHSISLALTVLGVVRVPAAPAEACIALSIVLVAAECARGGDTFAHRAPWGVAFAFGLLHGLGFASALLELGLPDDHVAAALVFFNVGVELGQLAIIAAALAVGHLARRLAARPARLERANRAVIYTIGSLAAFWSIDRIAAALFPR